MSPLDAPAAMSDDVAPRGTAAGDADARLLAGLRRADPDAINELVERYAARAYRVAIRITRNAADAEEAVQDALWNGIRNADSFRGDAAFGSWFYRIVANAACQKVRRTAHRRVEISLEQALPRFHEDGAPEVLVDWSGRLDDPAVRSGVRAALSAAIDDLTPDYRAVVVLRDLEGLTVAEAAAAMGITIANAKTRLHRARLFLRKRLSAFMTTAA